MPVHQTCSRCRQSLPLDRDHFYQWPESSPSAGRFSGTCRSCVRRRRRAIADGLESPRSYRRRGQRNSRGPRFGIEIEFIGDRERVISLMQSRGIDVRREGWHHTTRRWWKMTTDGSLAAGGWELVSPPLAGEAGAREVELACEALVEAGARVDVTCGLHVHHEVRELDAAAIGRAHRNWYNSQIAIDGLVSRSRRGTRWARALSESEVSHAERLRSTDDRSVRSHFYHGDRYRAFNVMSYPRYGTIEIRQHQGTINARKVLAWIQFGQAFFRAAQDGADLTYIRAQDLVTALQVHGLSEETAAYLRTRADQFERAGVQARTPSSSRRNLQSRASLQTRRRQRRAAQTRPRDAQGRFLPRGSDERLPF